MLRRSTRPHDRILVLQEQMLSKRPFAVEACALRALPQQEPLYASKQNGRDVTSVSPFRLTSVTALAQTSKMTVTGPSLTRATCISSGLPKTPLSEQASCV